jgi:hypothetical protein
MTQDKGCCEHIISGGTFFQPVQVRSTYPHGLYPNQNFIIAGLWNGFLVNTQIIDAMQAKGFHIVVLLLTVSLPWRFSSQKKFSKTLF